MLPSVEVWSLTSFRNCLNTFLTFVSRDTWGSVNLEQGVLRLMVRNFQKFKWAGRQMFCQNVAPFAGGFTRFSAKVTAFGGSVCFRTVPCVPTCQHRALAKVWFGLQHRGLQTVLPPHFCSHLPKP